MKMKWVAMLCLFALLFRGGFVLLEIRQELRRRGNTFFPGDIKEGWRVFIQKKCGQCHAIWGEGGKGGPDLGALPQAYVSQAQLAALDVEPQSGNVGKNDRKEDPSREDRVRKRWQISLPSSTSSGIWMNQETPRKERHWLMAPVLCATPQRKGKPDLSRWGMYTNPILWAQMMWNHSVQMEKEMKRVGLPNIEFKGNEMVDLIAYIRSLSPGTEKVYLSPGDSKSGERLLHSKRVHPVSCSWGRIRSVQEKGVSQEP